ncbi:MAG: translocation/assembly module TamB domain-containing protein [Deltaproteobacteria bacterium]|nr:translocation/assembly module TamB domain-containing protein [Deltaproteobacteria bacterium]
MRRWWLRLENIAFLPFRIAIVLIGIVMIVYFLLFLFLKSPEGIEYVSKKIRDVVRQTTGLNINLESIRLDIFTAELRISQFGLKDSSQKTVIWIKGLNASLSIPYLLLGKFVVSEVSIDGIESELEIRDGKIVDLEELFGKRPVEKKGRDETGEIPDITIEKFLVSNLDISLKYEDLVQGRVELQELSGSYIAKSADINLKNLNAKVRIKDDFYNVSISSTISLLDDVLLIRSVSVSVDNKKVIVASGDIKNLSTPEFDINAHIDIPLFYLKNYPVNMHKAGGDVLLNCKLKGSLTRPIVDCNIVGSNVNIEEFKIGHFSGDVIYDNGDIQVRDFKIDNYGNRVLVNASGSIKDKVRFVGNVNITRLELAELLRNLGVNSIVMLDIKGSVDFVFYMDVNEGFIIETKPVLSVVGPKIFPNYYFLPNRGEPVFYLKGSSVSGDVIITERGVALKSVDVSTERSFVKVRNSFIGFLGDGYMDLKAESENTDLSDITPIAGLDIRGVAELNARIKGPFSSLKISGDVNARGFSFENFYGGTVRVSVEFFNNFLSFKNISGRVDDMAYSGEVILDMSGSPDIDATAEIKETKAKNIVTLLPKSFKVVEVGDGIVSIKARLKGPINSLSGDVETIMTDLLLWDEKIDRLECVMSLEQGDLALRKLLVNLYEGNIEANAKLSKDKDLMFEVKINGIKTGESRFIRGLPVKLSGVFNGAILGTGSLSSPIINFTGTVENFGVLSTRLGMLSAEGSLKGRDFVLSAVLEDKRITFLMKNDHEQWQRYFIKASIRDMDILRFFVEDVNISTVEDVEIDLMGDLRKGSIEGSIVVKNLLANVYDMKFELKSPVRLTLLDGLIEYSEIGFKGEDIEVNINSAQFNPDSLNVSGYGVIPLKMLKELTKNSVNATGTMSLDFLVQGNIQKPEVNVNGYVPSSIVRLSFFPHPFENTSLRFFMQKDVVVINELKGRLAGGTFSGVGEIKLESFVPKNFDLKVDVSKAFLSFPKELPSVVSGYITIGGDTKKLLIGGEIDVERAIYSKNVDFNMLLLELTKKRPKYTTYSKENEFVFFDIGIKAPGGIVVKNNLVVDSEFKANLRLTGSNERIGLLGTVNALRGKMMLSGNEYILKRGIVQFTERYKIAYNLDFVLSTVCHDTNLGIDHNIDMSITGGDENIRVQYKDNTTPPLSETDIVTCLALGTTLQKVSSQERGQDESFGIISSVVGVDQKLKDIIPIPMETFRISSKYSETLRMNVPQVQVSWKLMQNLRLNYASSLVYSQDQKIELDYKLDRKTSLRTQWNSHAQVPVGNLGVDIKWSWEF